MIKLADVSNVVSFNEDTHVYTLVENGKILSGVTQMMRQMGLSPDYSGIDEEVLKKAAEHGSKIHKACENVDKSNESCGIPEADWYLSERTKRGLYPVANEYLVTDGENIASFIDVVLTSKEMEERNEVILVDFKTTSSIHHEPLSWQLSIYKRLFEEQNEDIKVVGVYGVWLPKPMYGVFNMFEEKLMDEFEVIRLLSCFALNMEYITTPAETSNGESVLATIQDKLINTLRVIDEAKKMEAELKERLLQAMADANVKKWENDRLIVSRVVGGTSSRFDSTAFKNDHPDIYAQYTKETKTSDSLRIKLK